MRATVPALKVIAFQTNSPTDPLPANRVSGDLRRPQGVVPTPYQPFDDGALMGDVRLSAFHVAFDFLKPPLQRGPFCSLTQDRCFEPFAKKSPAQRRGWSLTR